MHSLSQLDFIPYLDAEGQVPDQFERTVGVYAIFDQDQALQYIGYSRDVTFSLKQHLVRQPQKCHWVKVKTIDRPNRTVLEEIRAAWIAENEQVPSGNGADETVWSQAIDAKQQMTEEERATYDSADDLGRIKLLKQVARRVEQRILADLEERGAKLPVRFDPKAKEEGLLSLK
jgi:hypothetical protein